MTKSKINEEKKRKEFSDKLQALLKEYGYNLGISSPQIVLTPVEDKK